MKLFNNTDSDRVRRIAERVNSTSNADFVRRLIDENRKILLNKDGSVSTHELAYRTDDNGNAVVYPEVQGVGNNIHRFKEPFSYHRAEVLGDTLMMSEPDAKLFTENYKSVYPGFDRYEAWGRAKNDYGRFVNAPGEMKHEAHGYPIMTAMDIPVGSVVAEEPDLFSEEALERRALKQRYAESGFRDKAVSKAGAQGAWQIMPITYQDYLGRGRGKAGDLNDPAYNRKVRDWVMSIIPKSLGEFYSEDDDPRVRLAKIYGAYNWGAGNMRKYLRKQKEKGVDIAKDTSWVEGLNPETKRYIKYLALDEDIDGSPYTNEKFEEAARNKGYMAEGGKMYKKGGKYTVKKGDSWIRIANALDIGLPDLLYWNGIDPNSREKLPSIHPGQEIYSSDPYRISASSVSANAPTNYVDYGELGRRLIDNYAAAVDQGAIGFNQVPSEYQPAVYQRGITRKTDKAADTIFKTGLNTALFLSDPVGYTAGLAAQKGAAYANDAVSGRNEYSLDDVLGYTPVMGTEYAEEHPYRALAADIATGAIGGSAIRNVGNVINNARQAAQNAAAVSGLERNVLSYPSSSGRTFGSVYKSGTRGSGKTGTVRMAKGRSGYAANSSAKGVFSNEASGASGNVTWTTPDAMLPISPIPFSGPGVPPVFWKNPDGPRVNVVYPEKHIFEQQSWSDWQNDNPTGEIGEYIPGTGIGYIRGEAPIGATIPEQALTRETTEFGTGYAPRRAVYVPGGISGDPTNIYSGLGITYGPDNPGSLIVGGYGDGGSIHIKPSHRGRLTELKARTGKSEAELYNDGNPAHKKMVVFARNARKWKHGDGGPLDRYSPEEIRRALEAMKAGR